MSTPPSPITAAFSHACAAQRTPLGGRPMLIATQAAAPRALGPVAAWVLLILAPLAVAGVVATYRERMVRWIVLISAFSNAFICSSLVFLLFYPVGRPDLATIATVASAFFAFGALRM